MSKFFGNCNNIIDWSSIVGSFNEQPPAYIGPRHKKEDDIIGLSEIAKGWDDAGYVMEADGGSVGWGMYFAGQHFSNNIVTTFANYVGITPVSTWVSCMYPGMFAPWHWDVNDQEDLYSTQSDMIRFTCHISKPSAGHIFVVDGDYLYNQEQGNVYQWDSRKSWHCGANFGYEPKYLFNMFGHKL
jgi:hypothetical protein